MPTPEVSWNPLFYISKFVDSALIFCVPNSSETRNPPEKTKTPFPKFSEIVFEGIWRKKSEKYSAKIQIGHSKIIAFVSHLEGIENVNFSVKRFCKQLRGRKFPSGSRASCFLNKVNRALPVISFRRCLLIVSLLTKLKSASIFRSCCYRNCQLSYLTLYYSHYAIQWEKYFEKKWVVSDFSMPMNWIW